MSDTNGKRPNPVRSNVVLLKGTVLVPADPSKGLRTVPRKIEDMPCPVCGSGRRLKLCCLGRRAGYVVELRRHEAAERLRVGQALLEWIAGAMEEGFPVAKGGPVNWDEIAEAAGLPGWKAWFYIWRLGYRPVRIEKEEGGQP